MRRDLVVGVAAVLLGLVLFAAGNGFRRHMLTPEMQMSVAAPIPLQLIGAAGDRYLAANVAVWRVLMTGSDREHESIAALARVQEDASFLNPGHEDNYVTATALLPWEGYVEPTQTILRRATEMRATDVYAPFFYGFNQIQFLGDAKGAYEYGRIAASHAQDEDTRQALTVISAAWLERGNDPAMAERVITMLAGELRDPQLREHLRQRAQRQRLMSELQRAADEFAKRHGTAPDGFDPLLAEGLLPGIPTDPLGTVDFFINAGGKVAFRPKAGK